MTSGGGFFTGVQAEPEEAAKFIPPDWFVTRWNLSAMKAGQPFRSALDPLVMYAWYLATERDRTPQPIMLPDV